MADTVQPEKTKGKVNGHTKHKNSMKARYQAYLTRSTCAPCRAVFRSPKKRFLHTESGHKSMVGVNKNRQVKSGVLS